MKGTGWGDLPNGLGATRSELHLLAVLWGNLATIRKMAPGRGA